MPLLPHAILTACIQDMMHQACDGSGMHLKTLLECCLHTHCLRPALRHACDLAIAMFISCSCLSAVVIAVPLPHVIFCTACSRGLRQRRRLRRQLLLLLLGGEQAASRHEQGEEGAAGVLRALGGGRCGGSGEHSICCNACHAADECRLELQGPLGVFLRGLRPGLWLEGLCQELL